MLILQELQLSPVQSIVADRTVHCNGLYSPLPETVVIRRTDGHNRKDENAWSD